MSLQKSLTLQNGIILSAAYIKIIKIHFNYAASEVLITIAVYKDQTAHDNGLPEVLIINHKCSGFDFTTYFAEAVLDDVSNTPLTQAQDWLLTLDFYSGASEV